MKSYLKDGIKKIGLEYSDDKIERLLIYFQELLEYNKHTNLTAIRDEKEILEKHFLDSLLLQKLISEKKGKKIIDIGTGAGFPGMVLAIFNPEIEFTLLDSVGKKTKFLELVKNRLRLTNVEIVNSRAEDYINLENRETYDIGLCRGVNRLNVILEYIIPFLRVGGYFFSQKMEGTEEEKEAETALRLLESEVVRVDELELPNYKDRRLVIQIKKNRETDLKYPRRAGVALKKPL